MTNRIESRLQRVLSGVAVTSLASLMLSGCTTGEESCADLYENLAMSVQGVESATFECNRGLTNGSEFGEIRVGDVTEEQATAIVEDVYKSFAEEPEIGDEETPRFSITSADGSVAVGAFNLGFNGDPTIGTVRDEYGIHPDDS